MRASDTDGDSSGAKWSRSDVNRSTALDEAARASRTTSDRTAEPGPGAQVAHALVASAGSGRRDGSGRWRAPCWPTGCHNATRVHATGTGRRLDGQDCRRVEPFRRCHPSVRSRRGPYVNSEARPGRRPENGPCAAAAQATGSPSGRAARRWTRPVPDQKDVPPEFGRDSLGLRAALPVTSPRWSSATWCSCR